MAATGLKKVGMGQQRAEKARHYFVSWFMGSLTHSRSLCVCVGMGVSVIAAAVLISASCSSSVLLFNVAFKSSWDVHSYELTSRYYDVGYVQVTLVGTRWQFKFST